MKLPVEHSASIESIACLWGLLKRVMAWAAEVSLQSTGVTSPGSNTPSF